MSRFENLKEYSKASVKIQAGMRGHLARKHYQKRVEEVKEKAKVLETYRTDKFMIDQFCFELKKKKLTLDKFYRICDQEMRQTITTKQFMDEINNLEIDFSEATKKKLVLVFDEDFNEFITYKEFIETCEAYGAELPLDLPSDYISVSKRALMKVVKKMKKKGIKPDFLFKMKDTSEVDIEDFKNFFRNTINARIKKREEHALFVL